MAVTGVQGVVLEVPDIERGRRFYTYVGLECRKEDGRLHFCCPGQSRDAVILVPGKGPKRLHHIALAADPDSFDAVRERVVPLGGKLVDAPEGFDPGGVWLKDPHGMVIHLVDAPPETIAEVAEPFSINQPGHCVRTNRSAMLPKGAVGTLKPLRLGHMLLFTPDSMASIDFFDRALGMGLADRAQDVVAFMCSRRGSDHHVVAFAKSNGFGFHHASFQMRTPDEVGIAGDRLLKATGLGSWGFGRHTIGSNFFYYVQDPWGSWLEYYCDIDYVADYDAWEPSVYGMEDSLHNWGPEVPHDFVHNYETDVAGFVAQRAEPVA